MGDLLDCCSENKIDEGRQSEFAKEIVTFDKPDRSKAIQRLCMSIESQTQRQLTNHRLWIDDDNDDDDSIQNKHKLKLIMFANNNRQNDQNNEDIDDSPLKDETVRNKINDDDNNLSNHNKIDCSPNSIDLDDGFTQSEMIPLDKDNDQPKDDNNPISSFGGYGGSGGGGGGVGLSLQRYQYEDLDLTKKIAEKRLKKVRENALSNKKKRPKDNNDNEDNLNYILTIPKQSTDCLLLPLTYAGTQIDKSLHRNSKELLISFDKINRLDSNAIIFDGEVMKISYQRSGSKIASRYFQITKECFKYFNSISSQQVYKNRPLLQIPIVDIDNMEISNDDMLKLRYNKIQFAFKLVTHDGTCYDFGCDDSVLGTNIITILTVLKTFIVQRSDNNNGNNEEDKPDFEISINASN